MVIALYLSISLHTSNFRYELIRRTTDLWDTYSRLKCVSLK